MPAFDASIITQPSDAKAVPDLINDIANLSGPVLGTWDDEARQALRDKARELMLALETPRETMIRHSWADSGAFLALTACVNKGVWNHLVETSNDKPFVAAEVGKQLGVDPPLMSRMMKHLGSMGYVKEIDVDTYNLTNFTRSLSLPIVGLAYPCLATSCFRAIHQFYEWADKNDWRTPDDVANGPLQMLYNTELNFFEHLHNVGCGEQFNALMGGYHQGRKSWMDAGFYPVKERLVDGFDAVNKDAAMIVDIGGNLGHDLQEFGRKHPGVPGRLVLQDLPIIIGSIKDLDSKIERMEYDFYTEQPVKGARVYFLHSVLHDWSDEICLKILANITAAMKPGYSKVLINENIIPVTGAHWEHTALDMMIMSLLSSKERIRADWDDLIARAGLKITGVYTAAPNAESLIECELA